MRDETNRDAVVTRRPRVLRWCSRCATTFLLSHGHGALGFAWIQRLKMYGARHSEDRDLVSYSTSSNEHSKIR